MDQNTEVTTESDKISPDEIAALRAQAAAELNAPKPMNSRQRREAERAEAAAIVAAKTKPAYVAPTNPDSIRQIIRTRLLAGEDTKTIAAYLAEVKPGTAAAEKSTIHIAFYRSKLRKEGLLPKVVRS